MTQSMSRVGRCIDNGPMEGFWGIIKRECYYRKRFESKARLVLMIKTYMDYYNNKRLQRNLGVLTPLERHESYDYYTNKRVQRNLCILTPQEYYEKQLLKGA